MKIKFESIGTYLEREVKIAETKTIDFAFDSKRIENSMLFVLLGCDIVESPETDKFITYLISLNPVGVAFAGNNARYAWDVLVYLTSIYPSSDHIMTYFTDEENLVEDLKTMFYTYIPSGDRWNSWTDNLILCIGDAIQIENVKAIFRHNFHHNE